MRHIIKLESGLVLRVTANGGWDLLDDEDYATAFRKRSEAEIFLAGCGLHSPKYKIVPARTNP